MTIKMPIWWSVVVLLAFSLGLAGCDGPSPGFMRYPAHRVVVDGSRFAVRFTRYEAQAIRISPQWPASRGQMVLRGARAIQIASGCAVRPETLSGDKALVRADLDCAGAAPRAPARGRPARLDCDFVSGFRDDGFGGEIAEFECGVLPD